MYTQAMDTMGKDRDDVPKAIRSADEVARQAAFDARIDAGDGARDDVRLLGLVGRQA